MSVEDKVKELAIKANELRAEFFPTVKPLYPWVLVWTLPAQFTSPGGIILLDSRGTQKTHLTGLVLASWGPDSHEEYLRTEESTKDGKETSIRYSKVLRPSLLEGDLVAFPHHVGWPVSEARIAKDNFRLVKEEDILGTIEYSKDSVNELFETKVNKTIFTDEADPIKSILHDWLVYPRFKGVVDGSDHSQREET